MNIKPMPDCVPAVGRGRRLAPSPNFLSERGSGMTTPEPRKPNTRQAFVNDEFCEDVINWEEILPDECFRPEQWAAMHERSLRGEERLLLAHLERCIVDMELYSDRLDVLEYCRRYSTAKRWFKSDRNWGVFSFVGLCEHFGMDVGAVRHWLKDHLASGARLRLPEGEVVTPTITPAPAKKQLWLLAQPESEYVMAGSRVRHVERTRHQVVTQTSQLGLFAA